MLFACREISRLIFVFTALLLAAAVCSHHFVSMSGVRVLPLYPGPENGLTLLDRIGVAAAVWVVSSLLISAGVGALFFDRYLADVKGLANATFEAVVPA